MALARHPPPSKLLWAAEMPRALWSRGTAWRHRAALRDAPRGDGHPVMVLPGLFNADPSTAAMRGYLERIGYRAEGWGLGPNVGVRSVGVDAGLLLERIIGIRESAGRRVTLVGVSLGGVLARLAAHRRPDLVAGVVTVAAPYAGDGRATNVWRLFEWTTGERIDDPAIVARSEEIAKPPPVPATAIWSASDGIVNGSICRCDHARSIEIRAPHLRVQRNPVVFLAIARALADQSSVAAR